MMTGLEYAKSGAAGEALDGRTFCQRDGERYDIYAQFPAAGSYILKAYAKRKDDPGKYNSVLEYRIDAASGGGDGFPVAFGKFSQTGAYLYGPLEGKLVAGSSYLFRIRAPGAQEVAVVCGKEWTHLACEGGSVRRECDGGEGGCGSLREVSGRGVGWAGEIHCILIYQHLMERGDKDPANWCYCSIPGRIFSRMPWIKRYGILQQFIITDKIFLMDQFTYR